MNDKLRKYLLAVDDKLKKDLSQFEYKLLLEYEKSLFKIREMISKAYEKAGVYSPLSKTAENARQHFIEMAKYGRLEALEAQIADEIKNLTGISFKLIGGERLDIFVESYNLTKVALNKTLTFRTEFSKFNTELIKAKIDNPLYRKPWGARLKEAHSAAYDSIMEEITLGLQRGSGYAQTATKIEGYLYQIEKAKGVTKVKGLGGRAVRLVRTETHRIQTIARNEALDKSIKNGKSVGIDLVKVIWAVLDSHTRPQSQQMHGQMAGKDGSFRYPSGDRGLPGETGVPEYDINDRETIILQEKGEYLEKIK